MSQDLRAWRTHHSLTQEEAASLVGVHKITWCRWEIGSHTPHPMVYRIIELLGPNPTLAEEDYGKRRLGAAMKKKLLESTK